MCIFPQEFASFGIPDVVMNLYSFNICAYNYTCVMLYSYIYTQIPTCQVVYWLGGATGACLSAYLSSTWGENTSIGGSVWMSFLGGALLLFGARLASGCTRYRGMERGRREWRVTVQGDGMGVGA